MSPDWATKAEPVPYAKLDNPQTLNLYNYVQNNPLSHADADGHEAGYQYGPDTFGMRGAFDNVDPVGDLVRALRHPAVQGYLDFFTFGALGALEEKLFERAAVQGAETLAARAGTLTTLGETSGLTLDEISTGERFAAQSGLHLQESTHIGAEFVDAAGKTYDAMGHRHMHTGIRRSFLPRLIAT